MATLVTIPFSHFCEKARWALDYTGYDYVEEGHMPVLHRFAVWRATSPRTSVPVLVAGGHVFGDSTEILAHADASARPERKLYPDDAARRAEVQSLEDDFDERLGPHIRRVIYFYLLPNQDMARKVMDRGTPSWERATVRLLFPVMRRTMNRFMEIDARTAAQSRDEVLRTFDDVERRLGDGRPFLTGDRFTAADLTFAALAGVAVFPPESEKAYPSIFSLGGEVPQDALDLVRETQARPVGDFVRRIYREHRGRPC
ncbi:glutathione S-transferase family protein [Pendulispora rubella]|uniref:Glutathione S-transferase family protein n=1 Tax=Pendulispora rubella TaxID=2741070 RepID=A0ABZ2KQ29_9BACT